jgi:hypothetical protein
MPALFLDKDTEALFNALAREKGPLPSLIIRRGDIGDKNAKTGSELAQVAVTPTIIANLLAYLKNSTTGQGGKGQPRYQQHPEKTRHTFGGYHVDDWVRAFTHALYFLFRRRGKSQLDGSEGPRGKPGVVLTFRGEDSSEMLSSEQHGEVAQNVQSLLGMQLAATTRRAKLGSTADKMRLYTDGGMMSRMHRRTIMAIRGDYAALDRKKLKKGQTKTRALEEDDIPPIDGLTLHSIIEQHYDEKRFERPLETRITGDITEKFPGFFADKQSFADFLATQEKLVDRLAGEEQGPNESFEESRKRVLEEVHRCFAVKDILLRGHPFSNHPKWSEADLLVKAMKLLGRFADPEPTAEAIADTPADKKAAEFVYKSLKNMFPWAQWDIAGDAGKHLLPHEIVGKWPGITPIGVIWLGTPIGVIGPSSPC